MALVTGGSPKLVGAFYDVASSLDNQWGRRSAKA
jgi:hypothetical protein